MEYYCACNVFEYIFALAACPVNVIGLFAPRIAAYSAAKYGGICPAGLSSVIGMNKSLVGYGSASHIGAYTRHNNGGTSM